MNRTLIIIPCLFLSACATAQYTPTTGDPARMHAALVDCRAEAFDAYYKGKGAGIAAGGLVGGALGGLLASQIKDDNPMKLDDISPMIFACMAKKGYSGTGEN